MVRDLASKAKIAINRESHPNLTSGLRMHTIHMYSHAHEHVCTPTLTFTCTHIEPHHTKLFMGLIKAEGRLRKNDLSCHFNLLPGASQETRQRQGQDPPVTILTPFLCPGVLGSRMGTQLGGLKSQRSIRCFKESLPGHCCSLLLLLTVVAYTP